MFRTVAKLLAHRQLKFEEGYISLFEQRGLMLPVSTVVQIQKNLERIGKENLLYLGAKRSGREWIKEIFQIYGMDTIEEQANWGEETFTLAGNGRMKVVTWDSKEPMMIYQVYNSAIAEEYGKADHAVDQIPRGWFAGASCVFFNKDVDAVEIKCLAMGNELCEFIVKPRDKFDFHDEKVKRQLS